MEKQRKLLIAGGSHAEYPVILAAQQAGWYVITTGNDEHSIGHQQADKYINGDYSDKDFVLELARQEQVCGMVSGANDFSYLSVAYACEKLGLKGHDSYATARRIHLKNEFRQTLGELGIKTPAAYRCASFHDCEQVLKSLSFPVVVKPVDLTGGKGVKVCSTPQEVQAAFEAAMQVTREQYVLIEKFIEGSSHGFSSFLRNGKVVWYVIDNEQYGSNKYLVLGACCPSDITHYAEYALINDVEKLARACQLVDGLFHVQFVLDGSGYPVMIDPCRRMPGDLYVLLAKYTTGVDVPLEILNYELGNGRASSFTTEHNFIARECIMGAQKGRIKEIFIDDALKEKIIYSYLRDYREDVVDDPLKYKAGILIMKFDSYSEMQEYLSAYDRLVRIEME